MPGVSSPKDVADAIGANVCGKPAVARVACAVGSGYVCFSHLRRLCREAKKWGALRELAVAALEPGHRCTWKEPRP